MLEAVENLPVSEERDSQVWKFVNPQGDDVEVLRLRDNDALSITIESRDFDPAAPYDSEHVYTYRQFLSLRADGTSNKSYWREIGRFPDGWDYTAKDPRNGWSTVVGETVALGEIDEVDFLLRVPARLDTVSRRWDKRVYEAQGAAAETQSLWDQLSPHERIPFLLSGAPGVSIRVVGTAQTPFDYLTDAVAQLTVDPTRALGSGYDPNAAENSGWNRSFNLYASHAATRRGFDIEESRSWYAGAKPDPRLAGQSSFLAEVTYAALNPKERVRFPSTAIGPKSGLPLKQFADTDPSRIETQRLVDRARFTFRMGYSLSEQFSVEPLAIVREEGGAPPSILIAYGDLVLRRELAPQGRYFLTVACQVDGIPRVQSVGPEVRSGSEIGERVLDLRRWQNGDRVNVLSSDVFDDSDGVFSAVAGRPLGAARISEILYDPASVMEAVTESKTLVVHPVIDLDLGSPPDRSLGL